MKEAWTTERRKFLNVKDEYEKRLGSVEESVSGVVLRLETMHAMGSTASSGKGSAKTGSFMLDEMGWSSHPSKEQEC